MELLKILSYTIGLIHVNIDNTRINVILRTYYFCCVNFFFLEII